MKDDPKSLPDGELNMRLRDIKARGYPYHGRRETQNSLDGAEALRLNAEFKRRTGHDHETVKDWILDKRKPTA